MVQLLLDRGADIDARDKNGWAPLHFAAAFSEVPTVVELLLDRGADATTRDSEGKVPFAYAVRNEHLKGTDVYWRLNEAQYQ